MVEANNNMPHLLTEADAADYLKVSPKTLESWRTRGGGPQFVRLRGRAIRYRFNDLAAFIESGLRASTSDTGRAPGSANSGRRA